MGSRKRPKPPPATAQEKAFARRSEVSLDKEIAEENRRKRLLLRSTLGSGTLLKGLASTGGTASFAGTTFAPRSAAGGGGRPGTSLLGISGGAPGGGTRGGASGGGARGASFL